jgi:hypothetical protein
MRVELPRRLHKPETLLMVVALIATGLTVEIARAETTTKTLAHTTTLVVFAEHRMPEGEWTDLLAAMRVGTAEAERETPALRHTDKGQSGGTAGSYEGLTVVRGDTMPVGIRVDASIVVYLHGDCTLLPRPRYVRADRLGWVKEHHGRIEPFIHVDCTQLVDMLGPMALSMNQARRNTVMAEAIARVILHEWIHVATQNPGHASHGVGQPQFGVRDLLADDDVMSGREKNGKKGKS